MDYVKRAEKELDRDGGIRNETHCLAAIGYAILALRETIARPQVKTMPFKLYMDGEEVDLTGSAGTAYEQWKRDPSIARPYVELRAELVEKGILNDEKPRTGKE